MSGNHKDITRLKHMLDSIEKMEILLSGVELEKFLNDFIIHLSAERLLEIIGEAAARLSQGFKEKYTHVPWNEMRNLRNVISHEYFDVDYKAIWAIIQNDVPELKENLLEILKNEEA